MLLLPFPLPVFLSKTLHYVGDCTTCVSMLVIGSILAEIQLHELNVKRILYYCAVRLLLIPLVVLGVLTLLHIDTLVTGVTVLLGGHARWPAPQPSWQKNTMEMPSLPLRQCFSPPCSHSSPFHWCSYWYNEIGETG